MMKQLLLLLILFTSSNVFAQNPLEKAKQTAQVLEVLPINDIPGTAGNLLNLLKPKLALSDAQGPKIVGLLTELLTAKSGIIGLAKSDPADYTAKFGGIKEKFLGGLKAVVTAAQYTKFLGLKPRASDAGNLLSHLFF